MKNKAQPTLISMCLLGVPCQWNGKAPIRQIQPETLDNKDFYWIPVCPEQLAGLPTPRHPVEIVGGGDGFDVLSDGSDTKLCSEDGVDYSDQFIKGAEVTLEIARKLGVKHMVTQRRSPSCSCFRIYDGTFEHNRVKGVGVVAAYLMKHGMLIADIDHLEEFEPLPDGSNYQGIWRSSD